MRDVFGVPRQEVLGYISGRFVSRRDGPLVVCLSYLESFFLLTSSVGMVDCLAWLGRGTRVVDCLTLLYHVSEILEEDEVDPEPDC